MITNFKKVNQNEWTENNGIGYWMKKYTIYMRAELPRPCYIVSQSSFGVSYDETMHSMGQPFINLMVRYIVDFTGVFFSSSNSQLYKSYNQLFLENNGFTSVKNVVERSIIKY